MAYPTKIGGETEPNCIKKGNLWLGIGGRDYGPTDQTGFYATTTPSEGGYTVLIEKSSGGPAVYNCTNDSDLIGVINGAEAQSFSTLEQVLNYAAENGIVIVNKIEPEIVTDELIFNLNASSLLSYPTTENVWYDLSGENNDGTLTNSPLFNSNGYLDFDGVDDYIELGSSNTSLVQGKEEVSMGLLFKLDALGSLRGLIGTLNYGCSQNLGLTATSTNLNFYNDTTTCYSVGVGGVETGKWLYAVGTYDGTTTKVYLIKDGVLNQGSASGTKSGATNTFTSKFRVMGPNHSYRTNGQCTNAFVYNKTLTEAEILQNYYGGPIVTDGLTFAIDANKLVSYENGSTTVSSMAGSVNGSLENGVSLINPERYWNLDGVDDYIQIDDWDNTTPTNTHTVEMWARWRAGSSDMFMGFTSYDIWTSIGLGFNTGAGDVWGISSTQVTNLNLIGTERSNWHHYIFEFHSQVQYNKMYIDGVEQTLEQQHGTTDLTSTRSFPTTFRIGTWNNNNGYNFNGDVAICRTYNRALTADEIKQNYLAQLGRFT